MSTQQSTLTGPGAPMPFQNALNNAHGVAQPMALSTRLVLHKDVAIDLASKSQLAFMSVLMLLASGIGNTHIGFSLLGGLQVMHGHDNSLFYYWLLVLGLGIWQRMEWQRKEKLGTEPHSFWPGDSRWFYDFIPLERKYIDLLVEPGVVFLAGAVCRYRLHFGLLGLWLMASSIALGVTEKIWQVKKQQAQRMHNNLGKEAQWWADYERTRPKGAATKNGSASPSVTIPTGNDDTLDELIAKNKRNLN